MSRSRYTQIVTAPPALRGSLLVTRYYEGAAYGSASFEFSVTLKSVTRASKDNSCRQQPIISYPFGGRVMQDTPWLTWRGEMSRHSYGHSIDTDTKYGTSPLVLVGPTQHDTGDAAAIIVAPADNFLTTGVALLGGVLSVGPSQTLESLPAGYSYSVSAMASSVRGVTQTVMDWGEMLQNKYDTRGAAIPSNPLNQQLSYTTALGEYFDYLAWKHIGANSTYGLPEEALLNVSAYFKSNELAIKLFMLDIWWVHNDPRGAPPRHCMYSWEPAGVDARAGVPLFPRGLDWLANATEAAMMPCEKCFHDATLE
jgi:hypothetical protein